MYDFLLSAHLLSALGIVISGAFILAWQLGAPFERRHLKLSTIVEQVGATFVLVFGVWLALYIDGYEIWDGWILGALVLYFVAAGTSARSAKVLHTQFEASGSASVREVAVMHWAYVAAVTGILVLMVFKPGA